MSQYFDTPMLVFACGNKGETGDRARRLIAESQSPMTTPHALAECFNALTYRLGYPPQDVRKSMAANLSRFQFVTLEAGDYRTALDSVVDGGMTGDKIYDALHVGAAIKGRATKIFTSNKRDFSPFNCGIPIET